MAQVQSTASTCRPFREVDRMRPRASKDEGILKVVAKPKPSMTLFLMQRPLMGHDGTSCITIRGRATAPLPGGLHPGAPAGRSNPG
jgi:hypothetical protein